MASKKDVAAEVRLFERENFDVHIGSMLEECTGLPAIMQKLQDSSYRRYTMQGAPPSKEVAATHNRMVNLEKMMRDPSDKLVPEAARIEGYREFATIAGELGQMWLRTERGLNVGFTVTIDGWTVPDAESKPVVLRESGLVLPGR